MPLSDSGFQCEINKYINKTNANKLFYHCNTTICTYSETERMSYTLVQFGNSLVTILSMLLPIAPGEMERNNKQAKYRHHHLL